MKIVNFYKIASTSKLFCLSVFTCDRCIFGHTLLVSLKKLYKTICSTPLLLDVNFLVYILLTSSVSTLKEMAGSDGIFVLSGIVH